MNHNLSNGCLFVTICVVDSENEARTFGMFFFFFLKKVGKKSEKSNFTLP